MDKDEFIAIFSALILLSIVTCLPVAIVYMLEHVTGWWRLGLLPVGLAEFVFGLSAYACFRESMEP